jgi:hypothetical protein
MQRARWIFAASLVAALSTVPDDAGACLLAADQMSYLHKTLPELPEGTIAADVEITTNARRTAHGRSEARIVSMIKGRYRGTKLIIEPSIVTSCDGIPHLGERGFVVGRVVSSSEDALVIDPIRVPSTYKDPRREELYTSGKKVR